VAIRDFLVSRRARITPERAGLPGHPDLRIAAGTAEPGSASETALRLLASWAATTRTEGMP